MMTITPYKAGLVFAALGGGWHLLWTLLVGLHWAQPFADFIFWIHFIKPVYVIEDFSIGRAAILIVVTSVIGYIAGYCLGWLWNWIHRQPASRSVSAKRSRATPSG